MNDNLPPPPESAESPVPEKSTSILKALPPWRWAWIGFALAAVLWFGSSTYFLKVHQFTEIEYQAGGMEEADYDAITRSRARYSMTCKIAAGVLCLASLTYLISQTDIHRPRKNS